MDLQTHLKQGTIYIEDGMYIGIASDGQHVLIGSVGEELTIEAYLDTHSITEW